VTEPCMSCSCDRRKPAPPQCLHPANHVPADGSRSPETVTPPEYEVDAAGCWLWLGKRNDRGYALTPFNGNMVGAHRVYYQRHVGPIPEGHHVHHKCEVRHCVNPDHLVALSPTEHMREHWARFSDEEAVETARRYLAGEKPADIARDVGVTRDVIWAIAYGRNYKAAITAALGRPIPPPKTVQGLIRPSDHQRVIGAALRAGRCTNAELAAALDRAGLLRATSDPSTVAWNFMKPLVQRGLARRIRPGLYELTDLGDEWLST
jgi:hypothetical protein